MSITKKDRYCAPDLLCSRFNVAQINKVWTLDDVLIPIDKNDSYLRVLHIIDLSSRKVLNTLCTTKDFNSAHIARAVNILIAQHHIQDFDDEESRLIIHTDRDSHFTSKTWYNLFLKHPKKIRISMSPIKRPKANAVSERWNRNAKHMIFDCVHDFCTQIKTTLPEQLNQLSDEECNITIYKRLVHNFVNFYNDKHIHRISQITPTLSHKIHEEVEPHLPQPEVIAVRNNASAPKEHRLAVEKYKLQLISFYNKAQAVQKHTEYDTGLQYILENIQNIVQNEIQKLAVLNQTQFVSLSEDMQRIEQFIQKLDAKLSKQKTQHVTLPLRDPIAYPIYDKLMNATCLHYHKNHLIAFARFRIVCVLLYCTGCRVNEMRLLTYDDLQSIIKTARMQVVQDKVHEARFCVLGSRALQELERIIPDIEYLFQKLKFQSLGQTSETRTSPMHPASWIRSINHTLATLKELYKINLILKSHSFRIGYVTRHLKVSDIQKTAELIGHKSLNTTRRYNRFLLNTEQNKQIADKAFDIDV